MSHFTEERDPLALIYGDKLEGTRKKELPPKENYIPIRFFKCEISTCANKTCKIFAEDHYAQYGFEIHDKEKDTMSGKRGIIEPISGCDTPGHITKSSPKKGSRHDPKFRVKRVKNKPAVCFFDSWQTSKVKQVKINNKIMKK